MSVGVGSKYYSGFNPLNIGDCALWLDAADSSTITLSGSNVTTWRDKSGNGRNAALQSGFTGATVLSTNNGTVLNFVGTSRYLITYPTFPVSAYTVFTVQYNTNNGVSPTGEFYQRVLHGSQNNAYLFIGTRLGFVTSLTGSGSAWNDISGTTIDNYLTWRIVGTVVSNTSLTIFTDGTSVSTKTGTTGAFSDLLLGNDNANSQQWYGYVAEVLIYPRVLSANERQQVEGYLAWKWLGRSGSISSLTTFRPTQISGCTLWLDAADSSTFTFSSGSNISQWRDKSSSALAGTAVNSPTLTQSGINGFPSVSFNGTSQYIDLGNVLNMGTNQIYIFVVCQFNSTADGGIIGKTSFRANPSRWALVRVAGSAGMNMLIEPLGNVGGIVAAYADSSTSARVLTGYWDRSNIYNLENGVQRAVTALSSTSSLSNTDPVYIGAYPNSTGTGPQAGFYFGGTIAEILVYQATITTTQRQQVENYLFSKWGISRLGLPTTHPYSSILPVARPFQPIDVEGCALWLDAADPSTVTLSGSNVTAWRDKSGNSANATGVNNPTYDSTSIGVNFVRSSVQYMTLPNGCLPFNDSSYSYFFIFTPRSNLSGQQLIYGGSAAVFRDSFGLRTGDAGTGTLQAFWISYDLQTSNTYVLNTKNFGATYYASGGGRSVWINFVQGASDTPGVTRIQTPSNNAIGILLGNASTAFDGQMHEILVYNSSLSTTQRQQVEGYLARKWGLQGSTSSLTTFVPTQISNCALWLDAADASTVTLSGSNVTTWRDKSGSVNNATQSTASNGPVYSSNGLVFNGSNWLTTPITSAPSAESLFIVMRHTTNTTMDIFAGTSVGFREFLLYNGSIYVGRWGTAPSGTNGGALSFNTTYILTYQYTTTQVTFTVNGTITGSGTPPYTYSGSGTTFIGASTYAPNNLYGTIYEIVYYSRSLSSTERQQLEGYLARKWGLAGSLPSSHPFVLAGLPSTHPFISRLPMTTSFNPRQISNCALWLDAADPSTVTLSGVNITQLRDKSPNAYVISNANGFTYNQTRFRNTYPSFYNSTSVTGRNLGSNSSVSLSQPLTFFTVCSVIDTVAGGYIFDSANTANRVAFTSYLNGRPVMFAGVELFNTQSNAFVNPAIHSGIFNTTSSSLFLNGTLNVTGSAGTQTLSGLTVGARFNNVEPWTGHICEILIYSGALTTFQRQQVEGYLAWKWGLQGSLPSLTTFVPTQISGCALWLDAADASTVSLSGSNITGLTDKSSNRFVLSNASNFTYNQVKFNGSYPSFHTTGSFSSGHLGINSAFRLSQPFTAFVVGQATAASGQFPYILDSAPPSPSSRVVLYYWNNAGYRVRLFAGGEIEFNTGASAPFINTYRVNTTSSEILLNGTSVATGSIGSGSLVGIIVGNANANDSTQIWGGHICEILLYNSLLSTTQRQQVESYLATKWGLSGLGLSSTHPYKTISPI